MKTFSQMLQEFPHDDKLDNLRHASVLSPKRQKQLSVPLIHFEDFDYEIWQNQYPPSNTSLETFNELKYLQSLQHQRGGATESIIIQDKDVLGSFKKYLNEHKLEVDMERLKEIYEEAGAIILTLKRFYDRPRPKKLAKVLGIKLTEFQLKTAETPSYPSGHAVQGRLLGKLIADELPLEHRANILDIGKRMGYYRQIAGAHYGSDTVFGHRLADELYRTVRIPVELGEIVEEEQFVSIDSTLPTDAAGRTEVYEGCAIIHAMRKGLGITSHPEFSKKCKDWIDNTWLPNIEDGEKVLLDYCSDLGASLKDLGTFKDFIHQNINDYYNQAPEIFQVPLPDKVNTADAVMITKGTRATLFKIMGEFNKLDKAGQHSRIKTNKSLVSLLDDNGKEMVSFYQISLKKDASIGGARIGKLGSFAKKRFTQNISPSQPENILKIESLQEFENDLLDEGLKDIVRAGADALAKLGTNTKQIFRKIKSVFNKLAMSANKVAQKVANGVIKKSKMVSAANQIAKELVSQGAHLTEEGEYLVEGSRTIKANKPLVKQVQIFSQSIKGDVINKQHSRNKNLVNSLNKKFAIKNRPIEPIIIREAGDVTISSVDLKKLKDLYNMKVGDTITLGTGSPMDTVFKLTSNWAGMNYITGILQYVEKQMGSYENLSSSLFALAAEFEGEARFGNTNLPLVIVYGGKKGHIKHLGTRDDFEKGKVEDLSNKGREYNEFPVLVIRINKVAGQSYNTINILLVHSLDGIPPVPEYLQTTVGTSSGSKFATKFEVNNPTKNWKGNR